MCNNAGIAKEQIWLDPGIGFGKSISEHCQIINHLADLVSLGQPIVIGVSRKSFLAKVVGEADLSVKDRLAGTIAVTLKAHIAGVEIFRVHDVREISLALRTWNAVEKDGTYEQ